MDHSHLDTTVFGTTDYPLGDTPYTRFVMDLLWIYVLDTTGHRKGRRLVMENLTKQQRYEIRNPGRWRQYYLDNKEKVDARVKGWRQDNPDKIKLYRSRYELKREQQ